MKVYSVLIDYGSPTDASYVNSVHTDKNVAELEARKCIQNCKMHEAIREDNDDGSIVFTNNEIWITVSEHDLE